MVLNRRHKAILFLTLVFVGCALLFGIDLKEALGSILLGVAFAWAVGSDVASSLYASIKGASGTFYSWIRLPLAMALAGCLLGAALIYSRANPVVVVVLMCAGGTLIAPLSTLPTKKIWLRIPLILIDGAIFLLAVGGMVSTDEVISNRYAERFGELAALGFAALLVGIFWLYKGWKLIESGIATSAFNEPITLSPKPVRAFGKYVSFFIGFTVLTLWLSLLTWLASSAWAYAPEKTTGTKDNNLLVQVGFCVVLALWPYLLWRSILGREPNSEPKYLHRHRRITAIAGMLFVIALSLGVTYGIQNGNDQHMVEKITAAAGNLTTVGTKIGAIKQRDLQTTTDYIQAYAEIEALLPDFELAIERCADTYQEARQMDERRGYINTQLFYKSHNPDTWKNDFEMLDLLRQVDSLTREETLTARNMAALPESEQVAFWQNEFRPLLVQGDSLREKIQTLAAKIK